MKVNLGQRVFSCSILLMMVYLLLLALLLNLGNWQLKRSKEKMLLLQQQQMQATTILNLQLTTEDNAQLFRYRPVTALGEYDVKHQFLLDNQIVKGKAGYFVLTPFKLQGGKKAVLVNRGWLPANPNRSILPVIDIKKTQTLISGKINHFPSVGIKLANVEIPTQTWPALVQVINSQVLAKKLGYPLFSFQVELDKQSPEGYGRQWQENTLMRPEQHVAYAMQWFGLALTLSILFFWQSIKKRTDD